MATATANRPDERLQKTSLAKKLMGRPELGAVAGAILVFIFFGITAAGSGMFSAWASSPSSVSQHSWASSPSPPPC